MPSLVYPSDRLFSEITLSVLYVRIDGVDLPDHNIDPASRAITLYTSGRPDWQDAEIVVRVDAPFQEIKSKRLDDDHTLAIIRIDCGRTNLRSGEIVPLRNGSADLRLTLRREHVAERVFLECFIVRDTDDGFARILADGQRWEVLLTEKEVRPSLPRPPRPGGLREFLEISWEDFTDTSVANGALLPFAREAYYLDVEADPPVLFLNRSIQGYHSLLNPNGGTASKTEAVFRELEFKRISLGVWLALCFEALSCIVTDNAGEIAVPDGWRGEILKLILPRIFPGESLDAANRKIVALRGETGTSSYLLGKLEIAVNEHISTSTTLKKHLMALMREGD